MKMRLALAWCAVALWLFARTTNGAEVAAVAWLAGCWSLENSEPGTVEVWMKPAGGVMLGMSRTIRKGVASAHEFMQIRSEASSLVFIAQPSNQARTTFAASRMSDREVVFENLNHDFPQRIIYRWDGKAALRARIEGMREGTLRGVDYAMKKVSCE